MYLGLQRPPQKTRCILELSCVTCCLTRASRFGTRTSGLRQHVAQACRSLQLAAFHSGIFPHCEPSASLSETPIQGRIILRNIDSNRSDERFCKKRLCCVPAVGWCGVEAVKFAARLTRHRAANNTITSSALKLLTCNLSLPHLTSILPLLPLLAD